MRRSALELRQSVQAFVRAFGLLSDQQTPCGQPLPASHAHALLILLHRDGQGSGGPKQQELATALALDKSSITRLCARMVDAGHLQQVPSRTDGRAKTLALTAKGKRVAGTLEEASKLRFRRLVHALPSAVMSDEIVRALDTLTAAVLASAGR